VSNSIGLPLSGVSVQGEILEPPSLGGGFTNVLDGVTTAGGSVSFENLSALEAVESSWVSALGPAASAISHPDVVLFLTYASANGTYFEEQSSTWTPAAFLADVSSGTSMDLPFSLTESGSVHFATRPVAQAGADDRRGIATAVNMPPSPQSCNSFVTYCWEAYGPGNVTPLTWIPVAWGTASGNVRDDLSFVFDFSDTLDFNLGVATGVGFDLSGTGYGLGGTVYSTTASGEAAGTVNPDNGTAYEAIYGQAVGQEFQEYQCGAWNRADTCIYYTSMNNFQYDAGMDPQISGGYIASESGTGTPPYTSSLSSGFTDKPYGTYTGDGNTQAYEYQLSSENFVNTFFSEQSSINVGINIGFVLDAFFPEALPVGVILNLEAGLADSEFSFALSWIDFDGPANAGLALNIWVGSETYYTSGGSGTIPLMAFILMGGPNSPTGLHVTGITNCGVTCVSLAWSNPSGPLSANSVYYNSKCSNSGATYEKLSPATTSATIAISEGGTYYFWVNAWNRNQVQSAPSACVSASV
jgi:hypothetical protein